MRPRLSNTAMAYLLLLGTVFVWGATFSVVKGALLDVSPLLFNLLRMALATILLVAINHRGLRHLRRRTLSCSAIAGLFLAGGYEFQTTGLALTTPTKSAMLTGLVVVIVPLLTAFPALRPPGTDGPGWGLAGGALLSFAGLVLLTSSPGMLAFGSLNEASLGDLLSIVCAFAFAGHLLTLAHFSVNVPIRQLATLQIAFATITMGLALPFSEHVYLHVTVHLLVALAITAVLGTAAAFTIQSWSQQFLKPAHTAILLTLEPVFALLVSFLFLGERFTRRSSLGAGLILCGIVVVEVLSHTPTIPDPA